MKLKIISFCLLFVLVFFSCKKEEPMIVVKPAGGLLSKVMVDKKSSIEYVYNVSNMISEEKSKFDFTLYHYNDRNQVLSADYYVNYDILSIDQLVSGPAMNRTEWVTADNSNKGGTFTYEYNNSDQLIKMTYSRASSSISEYSEFSYDADNRINMQTLYWDNKATGYIEYSYDAAGNLIKETLYNLLPSGTSELSTTTEYGFDNKFNPYQSTGIMIPGISTNKNNIIKEVITIHLQSGQGADKVQTTENTYEYNSEGFPVKQNGNIEFIYL